MAEARRLLTRPRTTRPDTRDVSIRHNPRLPGEEANMKHASSHALYTYWDERRGTRAAPERLEFEPREIGRSLTDTFMLAYDPASAHPFRLAGTRICTLFGRELRGEPFENLWRREDRGEIRSLVAITADEASGVVAGVRGRSEEGDVLDLELLLLPLRHRGRT